MICVTTKTEKEQKEEKGNTCFPDVQLQGWYKVFPVTYLILYNFWSHHT